jgi:hypothetical protein
LGGGYANFEKGVDFDPQRRRISTTGFPCFRTGSDFQLNNKNYMSFWLQATTRRQ